MCFNCEADTDEPCLFRNQKLDLDSPEWWCPPEGVTYRYRVSSSGLDLGAGEPLIFRLLAAECYVVMDSTKFFEREREHYSESTWTQIRGNCICHACYMGIPNGGFACIDCGRRFCLSCYDNFRYHVDQVELNITSYVVDFEEELEDKGGFEHLMSICDGESVHAPTCLTAISFYSFTELARLMTRTARPGRFGFEIGQPLILPPPPTSATYLSFPDDSSSGSRDATVCELIDSATPFIAEGLDSFQRDGSSLKDLESLLDALADPQVTTTGDKKIALSSIFRKGSSNSKINPSGSIEVCSTLKQRTTKITDSFLKVWPSDETLDDARKAIALDVETLPGSRYWRPCSPYNLISYGRIVENGSWSEFRPNNCVGMKGRSGHSS